MEIREDQRIPPPVLQGAICVIDGDQGVRNSLFMLLRTLGLNVATFPTAEDFLDRTRTERPAFLITEISLPGMSGFELKEKLDRKGISIPTIGLTCEGTREERKAATRLGFLDLVEKPFVYWTVVERVQQAVTSPV